MTRRSKKRVRVREEITGCSINKYSERGLSVVDLLHKLPELPPHGADEERQVAAAVELSHEVLERHDGLAAPVNCDRFSG
jgi:hypothetical protein